MRRDDRETLRRIAAFNRTIATAATDAIAHGNGELRSDDVRALGRQACDLGMALLADADRRDAIDGTVLRGSIRRLTAPRNPGEVDDNLEPSASPESTGRE